MSNDRLVALNLMAQAAKIVGQDRGQQHGDVEQSFTMIGEMWSTWLFHRTGITVPITPFDVASMMADVKKARSAYGDVKNPEHYADNIGYTALAGMLMSSGIPGRTEGQAAGHKADHTDGGTPAPQPDLQKMEDEVLDEHEPIPAFLRNGTGE